MRHNWEKSIDPLQSLRDAYAAHPQVAEDLGLGPVKSDVWICKHCGQFTMSELGGTPDETLFGIVEECGLVIVRRVLDT